MRDTIGFDDRSFREMERLWSGILLFYFVEANQLTLVSKAQLLYDPAATSKGDIQQAIQTHFVNRFELFKPDILIVDGLLHIDVSYSDGVELRPHTLREWTQMDFDLAREIDAVLVQAGVKLGRTPTGRIFFRGQILED